MRVAERVSVPIRSGWDASVQSSPSSTTATAAAAAADTSIDRSARTDIVSVSANPNTYTASSTSTATRSSTRSITIVAMVAVTLSPSWRASRYGRSTSPARAGRTPSAANPITVARNVERKRTGPMGVSM